VDEAVGPATAVALFLGSPTQPGTPRDLGAGEPADLVLLRPGPLEMLNSLSSDMVAATLVGGNLIYARR
jgi:hypothetical protein